MMIVRCRCIVEKSREEQCSVQFHDIMIVLRPSAVQCERGDNMFNCTTQDKMFNCTTQTTLSTDSSVNISVVQWKKGGDIFNRITLTAQTTLNTLLTNHNDYMCAVQREKRGKECNRTKWVNSEIIYLLINILSVHLLAAVVFNCMARWSWDVWSVQLHGTMIVRCM